MTVQKLYAAFATILLAGNLAACVGDAEPGTAMPSASAGAAESRGPGTTASTTAAATLQPSPDRNAGWRADLASLIPGMAAIHPDLTHGVSRADLDAAVAALSATVDSATDDQLMVGVVRIVAMVSAAGCDAHTGA